MRRDRAASTPANQATMSADITEKLDAIVTQVRSMNVNPHSARFITVLLCCVQLTLVTETLSLYEERFSALEERVARMAALQRGIENYPSPRDFRQSAGEPEGTVA